MAPSPTRPVTVAIPHDLGVAEARRRLESGLGTVRPQLAAVAQVEEERWSGDVLTFTLLSLGQRLPGRVEVQPAQVLVEIHLPWMLALAADKLKGLIRRQGTLMLEDKGGRPRR
ncbi:MAG: hypothetical protein RLY86_1999 [Pseudomonadota bacterium]|jgi:hypothetical protein